MKNGFLWASGLSAVLIVLIQACKSDPDPNELNSLTLTFDHRVGDKSLTLGTDTYQNASGEDFVVTTFNYFISNISLKKSDGTTYTYPQDSSYFLVRETFPASKQIVLKRIPAGDYTAVTFTIGVDSLRNTMDISRRKGVLDPGDVSHDDGMYWSWNSGYIFMKLEGNSSKVEPDPAGNQKFRYHIGGYGGYNAKMFNNLRTVTLSLGAVPAKVGPTQQPAITIITDVAKIFDGVQKISLAANSTVMFSDYSSTIANNYASMFRVLEVKE
ncbi:MbnP family protein [Runella sp.]|uniref:MbnP family protein n=1 Tax=Runella sp. TaxID=1960881 RepID=UPI003D133BAD